MSLIRREFTKSHRRLIAAQALAAESSSHRMGMTTNIVPLHGPGSGPSGSGSSVHPSWLPVRFARVLVDGG